MPPYKTESTLRRGTACLSCRKRKLKCDGIRPVCRQCSKMNRSHSCEYDEKQQKSRTQLLKEQLAMLEKRLQELESKPSTSRQASFQADAESYALTEGFSAVPNNSPYTTGSLRLHDVGSSSSSSSSSSPSPSMYTSALLEPSLGVFDGFDTGPTSFRDYSSTAESGTTSWGPQGALSADSQKYLVDVFVSHRHQCEFYGSVERFYQQPGSQPLYEEPHPALMSVIFLLACHFTQTPHYSEMESAFFTQTLHEINAALDVSDRLVDIVQASSLLAVYLYINNRVLEGYRHAFSSIRLAVGLGLHQIRPHDMSAALGLPQQSSLIPLPSPQSYTELTDRVLTFWQVFMVDRCWSVVHGLPLALPDKDNSQTRIQTPWPIGPEDFDWEDHTVEGPIQMLFEGGSKISTPSSMCIPALKAKASALYEWTSRMKPDKSDWAEVCLAESALQSFLTNIPPLESSVMDYDYFAINTMVYTSFIHLQQGGAFGDRTFKAANSIIQLIHQLSGNDYQFLDPIVNACWNTAFKVFSHTLTNTGDITSTTSACGHGMDTLILALKSLAAFNPSSSDLAAKLEQTRNQPQSFL